MKYFPYHVDVAPPPPELPPPHELLPLLQELPDDQEELLLPQEEDLELVDEVLVFLGMVYVTVLE